MTDLWDRLAGQDRAVPVLRAAAANPGDAYLITGPPGVGKEEAARVFAAAVLCAAPGGACGTCGTCSRVLRGIHPDVVILEPEGYTFPVEVIREAVAQAALSPMEGARRVMIVEEADRITETSQNALLKALEEPNPSVTWVLVSTVLQTLLPTIISRCQLVELVCLPEEALIALLAARAGDAAPDDQQANLAVRAARGDADRALALLRDPAAAALRRLAIDAAIDAARPADGRRALEMGARVVAASEAARQAAETAAVAELAALEESLGKGRGTGGARRRLGDRAKRAARRAGNEVFIEFCRWLAQSYRDLAALAAGAPESSVSAPDRLEELTVAAAGRTVAAWLRLAEEAMAAEAAIRQNAGGALAVEACLLAPLALGPLLGEPSGVPAR
jgi:DNA polymerase-3 subunit delta'